MDHMGCTLALDEDNDSLPGSQGAFIVMIAAEKHLVLGTRARASQVRSQNQNHVVHEGGHLKTLLEGQACACLLQACKDVRASRRLQELRWEENVSSLLHHEAITLLWPSNAARLGHELHDAMRRHMSCCALDLFVGEQLRLGSRGLRVVPSCFAALVPVACDLLELVQLPEANLYWRGIVRPSQAYPLAGARSRQVEPGPRSQSLPLVSEGCQSDTSNGIHTPSGFGPFSRVIQFPNRAEGKPDRAR